MEAKSLFYQPSTTLNPKGLVLALLASTPVALILGYVYVLLGSINPLIYLGFLLTIFSGLFMGFWARVIARLTHNTSKNSQYIIAIYTGILMVYSHWVGYVLYAIDGIPSVSSYLQALFFMLVNFGEFTYIISSINEQGMWSIGRFGRDGAMVSGFFLGLVWLVESFILLAAPIYSVFTSKTYPYSEKLGKWYTKFSVDEQFKTVHNGQSFLPVLQANPIEAFKALGLGSATSHSRLHVYYLEGEQDHYLEVERVQRDTEGNTDSDTVIHLYRVDTPTAKALMEAFDHSVERVEVV